MTTRLRMACLASGSKGNAWLIEHHHTRVLVDCGLNYATLTNRMAVFNLNPADLSAVCLTHEHSDHIAGVSTLHKRHPDLPFFTSHGTAHAICLEQYQPLADGQSATVGSLTLEAFSVPHDASEPLQFRVLAGNTSETQRRLAVVTDLGHPHPALTSELKHCHALALEFNHDATRLATSRYPPSLKARIGGNYGHLSNDQALAILQKLPLAQFTWIVAAHLSAENNDPSLVGALINDVVKKTANTALRSWVCEQHVPSPWMEV
jgi:phosphoribosyl 1,2-cyclic phosphodiesterase